MNRTWTLKTLFVLAAVALVLVIAPLLKAGEYHSVGTLYCYECHVMHGSQAHGYDADGTATLNPVDGSSIGGSAPYENLLRNNENELCLTCHNNSSIAPDVLAGNTGKYTTEERQAGALNDNGSTSPYEAGNGHSLNFPYDSTVPGLNTSTWVADEDDGLLCIDCHEEHGNTNHRNIHLNPGGGPAVTVDYQQDAATNDTSKVVFVKNATRSYDMDKVFFNEPLPATGKQSALADWCKGCHDDFHGAVGSDQIGGTASGDFTRHPSTGAVEIGAITDGQHSDKEHFGANTNRLKVTSPAGDWGIALHLGVWTAAGDVPGDLSVTCLTCHKAHGNQNAFGLIYMSGTGTVTEEGDGGTITQMCQQCHTNGTTARTFP